MATAMPAPSTRLLIIIRTPLPTRTAPDVGPEFLTFNVRDPVSSRETSYYPRLRDLHATVDAASGKSAADCDAETPNGGRGRTTNDAKPGVRGSRSAGGGAVDDAQLKAFERVVVAHRTTRRAPAARWLRRPAGLSERAAAPPGHARDRR